MQVVKDKSDLVSTISMLNLFNQVIKSEHDYKLTLCKFEVIKYNTEHKVNDIFNRLKLLLIVTPIMQ